VIEGARRHSERMLARKSGTNQLGVAKTVREASRRLLRRRSGVNPGDEGRFRVSNEVKHNWKVSRWEEPLGQNEMLITFIGRRRKIYDGRVSSEFAPSCLRTSNLRSNI
jgi:hypothetical protein